MTVCTPQPRVCNTQVLDEMKDVVLQWRHLGMTSAAGFMLAPAFWPMVIVTVATVSPISSPAGE